jgi:hypothetical protein
MSLSPRVLWRFYRESLLKFGRILVMNTQAKTISFLQYNRKLLLEQYHVSKIALFGSFLFFLFTINIYASSLPKLQMNIYMTKIRQFTHQIISILFQLHIIFCAFGKLMI